MDDKPFESMNMIPFIDIMLVLLTIVLTTSSFIVSGKIPVHLPQASSGAPDRDRQQVIELDAGGQIHFSGRPLSADLLKLELGRFPRETPFVLRADRDVRLQRFVDVADVLKQLGFSRVAVQTEGGAS